MGWREQKRKARGDIHRTFQLPAVYLTHLGGQPVSVRVRLHRKPEIDQAVAGDDWSNGVSSMNLSDRIIFEASQVGGIVHSQSYVMVAPGEAYITGSAMPERDGFIAVEVTPLNETDLFKLSAFVVPTDPIWMTVL